MKKKIKNFLTDTRSIVAFFGIIGIVTLKLSVFAELPKRMDKVEATANKTESNFDKFLAVNTEQMKTQEVRDKAQDRYNAALVDMLKELKKANGRRHR